MASGKPLALRWLQHVDTTAGPSACWPWRGALNEHGYGVINHGGRMIKAHRAALLVAEIDLPDDAVVMHVCDNPPCVNPKHLRVATHEDNMADCRAKGRSLTGTKNHRAKLNPESVIEIRRRAVNGERYVDIGADFGISKSNISRIVNGKSWAHVW